MKRAHLLVSTLLVLAACSQAPSSPTANSPTASTPTLALTPASVNVNAGNPAMFFSANVQNSGETVTWTYSGPGSVAPSGMAASYTPPKKVTATESGTLTATLGSTGISATAPIVIYPANVTPPAEPPPTTPNPPSNPPANPPSNPNPPATPPADPNPPATPPNDPNPPAEPPATPDPTVTIAEVSPVTLGNDGKASASLDASISNAPSDATYQWTAEGANAASVSFSSLTLVDTTAMFSADGIYTLRLTVTAGSKSATATVEVMVNPVPVQDVVGLWTSPKTDSLLEFTLDLKQTGEDVTGTYTDFQDDKPRFSDKPVTGTFDGTKFKLDLPHFPRETINATVSGNTMTGTYNYSGGSYPFTATRQATP